MDGYYVKKRILFKREFIEIIWDQEKGGVVLNIEQKGNQNIMLL